MTGAQQLASSASWPSSDSDGDYRAMISEKPPKQLRSLRYYLGLLGEDAGQCSKEANTVLHCHAQFARRMARRMEDASKSRLKVTDHEDSETTRIVDDIRKASVGISGYVTRMTDNLSSVVSAVKKIQNERTPKKPTPDKQTWKEWIWEWMKYLFKALAMIFTTLGMIFVEPDTVKIPFALSTLFLSAAHFCGEASGAFPRNLQSPARKG